MADTDDGVIEFRTTPLWRTAYWVVAFVQAVVLSSALATGAVGSIVLGVVFLVVFFVLALQSRYPVHVGPNGIADERVFIRRAWTWDDVDAVQVRSTSWLRPEVMIRNGKGNVLPLNLRGLAARRDGEPIDRPDAVDAIARMAREHRVALDDQRLRLGKEPQRDQAPGDPQLRGAREPGGRRGQRLEQAEGFTGLGAGTLVVARSAQHVGQVGA